MSNANQPSRSTDFPYPVCTLKMDRTGALHVWRGHNVNSPMTAELYFQTGDDAEQALSNLPKEEQEEVRAGWYTETTFFPDEYFTTE